MGRRGFPSRTHCEGGGGEESAPVAPGYYWERPSEETCRRHVPPCIRTSKLCGSRAIVVEDDSSNDDDEEESTTPTAREARIPERLPCPPAPRKSRPSLACGGQNQSAGAGSGGHKEFFLCPPDLEAVFARRKPQSAK